MFSIAQVGELNLFWMQNNYSEMIDIIEYKTGPQFGLGPSSR